MEHQRYEPIAHRLAIVIAFLMFVLIVMGGVVTSNKAGMSVPDWPNSFGHNMFTLPLGKWTLHDGVFYEHSHRLLGTAVGLVAIAMAIWTAITEPRRWVRWLTFIVLGGVVVQGVLGGLRVVLNDQGYGLPLRIVHACIAQAMFCLAALMWVATSRGWVEMPDRPETREGGRRLIALAIACVAAIYLQLIAGALVRHYEAGLAIPDFPLTYGAILPPMGSDALPTGAKGSLFQIWIQFIHRVGAAVVSVLVLWTVTVVLRRYVEQKTILRTTRWLLSLTSAQVVLGILIVLEPTLKDILATAHVAVGALVLLAAFILLARAYRIYRPTESRKLSLQGFEAVVSS